MSQVIQHTTFLIIWKAVLNEFMYFSLNYSNDQSKLLLTGKLLPLLKFTLQVKQIKVLIVVYRSYMKQKDLWWPHLNIWEFKFGR